MSVEEKLEGKDIQMEEKHEEGKGRQVEHRTSQEARRTSVKRTEDAWAWKTGPKGEVKVRS